MKGKITAFIDGLIMYDYILFGGSFVLFILFIIFGILLRKKIFLALIFILLAFSALIVAPTYGYVKIHDALFKNSLTLTSQKRLEFTQAVVVKGVITNESNRDFSSCKVTASVYRLTSNKYKNYLQKLKPFQKMTILVEKIGMSEKREFKIIVEPFTYTRDYNISLGADCK